MNYNPRAALIAARATPYLIRLGFAIAGTGWLVLLAMLFLFGMGLI